MICGMKLNVMYIRKDNGCKKIEEVEKVIKVRKGKIGIG